LKGDLSYYCATGVGVSADGQQIVQELLPLHGWTEWDHSVAVSADGKRIVSGYRGTVRLSDARTGQEFSLWVAGDTGNGLTAVLSIDGPRIALGDFEGRLEIWHMDHDSVTLEGHTRRVTSVALSADGHRIVSGSEDETVKVWDARTGQELLSL